MSTETLRRPEIEYPKSAEYEARQDLDSVLAHPYAWTPLKVAHGPGGVEVFVKDERENPIGSFKWRGAFYAMQHLEEGSEVVTASAGNHAQGVADAAYRLGLKATIYIPETAPDCKVAGLRDNPYVNLIQVGKTFDEAKAASLEAEGTYIHPFASEAVYQGQGTVMTETLYQLAGLPAENGRELAQSDNLSNNRRRMLQAAEALASKRKPIIVFVPVGGGGLITGMTEEVPQWIDIAKQAGYHLDIRFVGVQMEGSDAMYQSKLRGEPTNITLTNTFAEGTAVSETDKTMFEKINNSELIYDLVSVDERTVRKAIKDQRYLDGPLLPQTIHEGAGALARAGLNSLFYRNIGQSFIESGGKNFELSECTLVTISSGKNIDPSKLESGPRNMGGRALEILHGPTKRKFVQVGSFS